ncbi:cytochrome P450 [Musa troglodytarum]|uniref:Cytochrome P450 n=1 Tax=Musa troglodytarum TaxID=320322 RepID=A0A9E7G0V1_9LILI|nr:cytochrome P450 [Musa troglodytarum]
MVISGVTNASLLALGSPPKPSKTSVVLFSEVTQPSLLILLLPMPTPTRSLRFKTAFGVELNCLGGSDHAGSEFAKAFDASGEIITLRYINVFWKIMRFLNIGSEATLKKKIKVVDDFVYKLIHLRIQQISSTANDSTKNEDILSRFLEESKKDPQNMSLKYLRDIMLNLVLAGKDSTASTLSWFFYLICKNPSVQEKIYQEVMEVIEASEDAAFDVFSRNIIDESLNNMHYLHAALSETLRLYPVAPIDNKVCFSDDILPGGYIVRKGDIVFYQPYAMGRMECLWGEDAEIFRQRGGWMMMASSSLKAPTSWSENLRKEVAYRQMKTFAAVLLRFFKFKLGDEKKVVHYKTSTTLLVDEARRLKSPIASAVRFGAKKILQFRGVGGPKEMVTPGENDQQSRKRKKKTAVGEEIGGRWPPIKPKRDLQINRLKGTNLFTIPNFFTSSESKAFVRAAESIGFIHQGSLGPAKGEAYRDNDRISVADQGLAESIWQSGLKRIFDDIKLQGKVAIGLNPNIRFYRYKVGQRFGRHIDESVDLGGGHTTQYTLLVYLTGKGSNHNTSMQSLVGGETVFYDRGIVEEVPPEEGMALLHIHGNKCMLHEARVVTKNVKYVLRSDVVFA